MGNYIAGLTAPSVLNVEDYMSELPFLQFEEELLGSRLFKVAKARRSQRGFCQSVVLKMFPCSNAVEVLSLYMPLIHAYCRHRTVGHNLLSFSVQVPTNERNILLVRDFIDQSLVDRLCTRPFLCIEEKRWIAFQLLQALSQLHSAFVAGKQMILCHGDIKAENVLLTSWGWLVLSDPAPFKPCRLPADNPSEFTHYFDSSRRRVCYLAPERFVDFPNMPDESLATEPIAASTSTTSGGESGGLAGVNSFLKSDGAVVDLSCLLPYVHPIKDHPHGFLLNKGISSSIETVVPYEETMKADGSDAALPESSITNVENFASFLTPSMDLFSTGCVLLELLTDGCVAFTLADLLAYRNGDNSRTTKLLGSIPCENLRNIVSNLLSLDGAARVSADEHLGLQKGKAFPSIFYTHLQEYMQSFLDVRFRNPTLRIAYIRRTLPLLLKELADHSPDSLEICAVLLGNLVTSVLRPAGAAFITQTPNTVATSKVVNNDTADEISQNAHSVSGNQNVTESPFLGPDNRLLESGKVDVLICYLELYAHFPRSLVFERIVPYCVELTSSAHSSEVRCLAVETLTQLLQDCTTQFIPPVEVSFFTEYLFPTLSSLSVDSREELRMTYARCLPSLTESALRFLASHCPSGFCEPPPILMNSDNELTGFTDQASLSVMESEINVRDSSLGILRIHVQERLADLDKSARHAFVHPGGLTKLATFFGRSHTSGTLLPHLITFVNDKDNHDLRTSFYRQVVPLVGLIGAQSISLLRPLLDQGLMDANEMVIEVCLNALSELLRHSLLSPPVAVCFLSRCLFLTFHPSNRIRQSTVGFIATFARQTSIRKGACMGAHNSDHSSMGQHCLGMWTSSSVHARLIKITTLNAFFRRPVRNSFAHDTVLLSALRSPVTRNVLDALVSIMSNPSLTSSNSSAKYNSTLLDEFFQLLVEREASRAITRFNERPCYTSALNDSVALVLARLQSLGLTERMESQLIHLRTNVWAFCESAHERLRTGNSYPFVKLPSTSPTYRTRLVDTQRLSAFPSYPVNCTSWRFRESSNYFKWLASTLIPGVSFYESLLCRKFLSGYLPFTLKHVGNQQSSRCFGRGFSVHSNSASAQSLEYGHAIPPGTSDGVIRCSSSSQLNSVTAVDRFPITLGRLDRSHILSNFPQGSQVAHLHEHSAGFLSLAVHMSGRLMASCSSGDGTVKLWNFGSFPVDSDIHLNNSPNSHAVPSSDISIKSANTKVSGFIQRHMLPTRSSWTYTTFGANEAPKACRGLLWMANGAYLATTAGNRWLHLIDVPTGKQCGLGDLSYRDSGRVVCLTSAAITQFPVTLGFIQPHFVDGADANLVVCSTTENRILGRDLRTPLNSSPSWSVKQDRDSGLIRSLALHSCHTWIVSGTSRGHIVCWDLRYRRPAVCVRNSRVPSSIVQLNLAGTEFPYLMDQQTCDGIPEVMTNTNTRKRTLIVASTDRDHGLSIWDLEASASTSFAQRAGLPSVTAEPLAPVDDGGLVATFEAGAIGYSPVRSTTCLPSWNSCQVKSIPLPSIVTGDKNGRLRLLDFSQSAYRIVTFGEGDTPATFVSYRELCENDVVMIQEVENQTTAGKHKSDVQASGLLVANRWRSNSVLGQMDDAQMKNASDAFPMEGSLEIYEPSLKHGNVISDICLLRPSQYLLASASMDGVIKVWQ